ncbi:hypothetical protein PY365_18835 [Roseiarcaceae bacterium H3SJ34-1]|jgi:hypothetical protein|uniref:hypothetical protein n=1 Tax=Terripilifer ovatus TaxID=3032367 RepID=UPI003AB95087|nr:hypothetical protein [Roseiarcaceae bacterium H3SJ34-1]
MLLWRRRGVRAIEKSDRETNEPTRANPIVLPGVGDRFMLASQRRGPANPYRNLLNCLRTYGGQLDRSVALSEGFQDLDLKEQLRRRVDRPLTGIARIQGVIPHPA